MNKLDCLKWKYFWQLNCVLMLNWIVWKRTVYFYKNGFGITYKSWYAIKPKQTNKQTFKIITQLLFDVNFCLKMSLKVDQNTIVYENLQRRMFNIIFMNMKYCPIQKQTKKLLILDKIIIVWWNYLKRLKCVQKNRTWLV